jgi:hypothetical protein
MNITSGLGNQYDFTKMTSAELRSAAKSLQSEGKISIKAEAELIGVASGVDVAPTNRSNVAGEDSVAKSLADPTQKNFLSYLEQAYQWQSSQPGTKGSELYLDVLNQLRKYPSSSTAEAGQYLSTIG